VDATRAVGVGDGSAEGLSRSAVEDQLERILNSEMFSRAERMKRFLRYAVERALARDGEGLREYSLGLHVFDRPESFDPRLDPIVRVEAGRLRTKLRTYYDGPGNVDPIHIQFRARSYEPLFAEVPALQPESPSPAIHVRTASAAAPAAGSTLSEPSPAPLETEASAAQKSRFAIPSVAVLPFANFSGDSAEDYFCDGLTDEIITALSSVAGLRVVSRTSVMQFKGAALDIRQLGEQLNVHSVLEGSVRKFGTQVRVTAQLVDASDGFHLWSGTFTRELEHIFDLQESIAAAIVRALRPRLAARVDETLPRLAARNSEAYREYLMGRHQWDRRSEAALRQAVSHFENAIALDPYYVSAHSGLADAYASLSWTGAVPAAEGWPKAISAAQRVLTLEPHSSAAHSTLAYASAAYDWDWEAAEDGFLRAIGLNARNAGAHNWYALYCLAPLGRIEEAIAALRTAWELDPRSSPINAHLGLLYYFAEDYDTARDELHRCLEWVPHSFLARWFLGFVLLKRGEMEAAIESFSRAREQSGGASMAECTVAMAFGMAGETSEAEAMLHAITCPGSPPVPPLDLSLIYLGLGDFDRWEECFHEALEQRAARLIHINVDPLYEPVRSLPAFIAARNRIFSDREA
jgi:TolB-like protein/Tfp pilus assembly protein PilF